MPEPVQQDMGTALHWAQAGGVDPKGRFRGPLHPDARPMKGKTLGGVIEVAVDHAGDTYRVMYAGLAVSWAMFCGATKTASPRAMSFWFIRISSGSPASLVSSALVAANGWFGNTTPPTVLTMAI